MSDVKPHPAITRAEKALEGAREREGRAAAAVQAAQAKWLRVHEDTFSAELDLSRARSRAGS